MKAMRADTASNVNNGFTYIGLMLFIAITGVGLSLVGMSWQYQVRSEKEKQLLFVGAEFKNALNSYYISSPNAAKIYPTSLNDLLLDKRMPNIKRHLRKIYLDPMTGKADWGFVIQQSRIVGIYSRSSLEPYKQTRFNAADAKLNGAKRYRDWIFGQSEGVRLEVGQNLAVSK
jgi:type II secretory pathway pseudopilin PulG